MVAVLTFVGRLRLHSLALGHMPADVGAAFSEHDYLFKFLRTLKLYKLISPFTPAWVGRRYGADPSVDEMVTEVFRVAQTTTATVNIHFLRRAKQIIRVSLQGVLVHDLWPLLGCGKLKQLTVIAPPPLAPTRALHPLFSFGSFPFLLWPCRQRSGVRRCRALVFGS